MANQIDTDSKIIGARTEGFGYPSIVRAVGGRIYAVHINDSGELEVHLSDNDGVDWTLDETFSEATDIDMPCIVAYNDTDIAVAYSFATAADVYTVKVKMRENAGGTWSEVYSAAALDCNYIIKPQLTVNKNLTSRLHLMYITNTGASVDTNNDFSDNKGVAWNGVTQENLFGASTADWINYSLDSDSISGNIYMTLYKDEGTDYMHLYEFDSDGAYVNVCTSPVAVIGACGAVASGNKRWTAYASAFYVYAVYKTGANTGTLGTISLSVTTVILEGSLSMGIDGNDNVYILYTKSDEIAYLRKYDADSDTWGDETAITSGDGLRASCEQHLLPGTEFLHYVFYSD